MEDAEHEEFLSATISCRLKASEHSALQPFFETFTNAYGRPSVSKALRWLLGHPKVIDVMNERIAERTRRAS